MIRIIIELWPFGLETHKKVLHTLDIANDGSGTSTQGNYKSRIDLSKWDEDQVINFPRKSKSALELLYLVLKKKYDK